MKVKGAQSCPDLCDLTGCSPPGSSVHGILQARVLEWVAMPFSRGAPQPRHRTWVSCFAGRLFANWTTREAQCCSSKGRNLIPKSAVLINIESYSPSCLNALFSATRRSFSISSYCQVPLAPGQKTEVTQL